MMKSEQRQWTRETLWSPERVELSASADLVLIFGETAVLKDPGIFTDIRKAYPKAHLFGCSTAGEIYGTRVCDGSVTTTAIDFESTQVRAASVHMAQVRDSYEAGTRLAGLLEHEGLTHLLALSVGLNVNGSELVRGLTEKLPKGVGVTGGLAGDQARFTETLVISDAAPSSDLVAVIGLYGSSIEVGSASLVEGAVRKGAKKRGLSGSTAKCEEAVFDAGRTLARPRRSLDERMPESRTEGARRRAGRLGPFRARLG